MTVDWFLVDARTLPPDVQAEARRRGLIPDLQAAPGWDGEGTGGDEEQR